MGNLFRSEEMSLVQLFIQKEAAHATVTELGEIGLVQFRDLNENVNSFQRTFVNEIKRCDEMERKIRFLTAHVQKLNIHIPEDNSTGKSCSVQEIDELDATLKSLEQEITQLNKNEEALNKNNLELIELHHVLNETDSFFSETQAGQSYGISSAVRDEASSVFDEGRELQTIEQHDPNRSVRLNFVTGVIQREKRTVFERILWRSLRGNMYMKQAEIEEPINDLTTGETHYKNVFIIFCQGEQLRSKVRKICEAFGAKLYPCPETVAQRRELSEQVAQRVSDLNNVLSKTNEHRRRVLSGIADNVSSWSLSIRKEKATYNTMNCFNVEVNSKCFIAEGWCPTADIGSIRNALQVATDKTQTMVPSVLHVMKTKMEPPTFNRTNKFTSGFQTIIDAYGVGKCREINPALIAIITFPFLFAVMFGDFGHGILMTLAALAIIWKEKDLENKNNGEIFGTLFGGRYIILLMGIFSMYTGLIYNDMFSKTLAIFDSGWEFHRVNGTNNTYVGEFNDRVYPFGLDYAWHGADNQLIFSNSYKMKMSIILGVMHMTLGVVLSVFNHRFFGKTVSVFNEFIPQLIFLESIFGYLTFTIIYKWVVNWDESPRSPPSLLNMLIKMFLSPGNVADEDELYSGQAVVQLILLIMALVSVPWMLLVKPLWLRHKHKHMSAGYATIQHLDEENAVADATEGAEEEEEATEHEEFNFGEEMVHQVIHTIEFCLGAISNTASYLRLWALSLAHAQLSDVLWDMTLGKVLPMEMQFVRVLGVFGAFSGWLALTIGVLLIMEGLSAFLHALRLHWVEFNQKFYAASGYLFVPFSFRKVLKDDEE